MRTRFAVVLALGLVISCGEDSPSTPTRPEPIPGPTITCPAPVVANTTTTTAQVAYAAPNVSGGTAPVTAACAPASGSVFNVGTTAVTCTATDAGNRQATCSFGVTVNRVPTLQRTSFLAFGDSVTAGEVTVPATTSLDEQGFPSFKLVVVPAASYPAQLQTLLRNRYLVQAPTITVLNSGVPGELAIDSVQRFSTVYNQARPQVVLILDGYNDLAAIGSSAVSSASAAVDAMARQARLGGSRVYIATLTPPRAGGRNTLPVSWVTSYNDRMRQIATSQGAVLVDLYSALVGNVALYIGVDGLHPTEIGYQKIAETFFNAIVATLETP
jgi:lysophospholipase L1-like esterase